MEEELYIDSSDYQKLQKLSEKEREKILYDRFEMQQSLFNKTEEMKIEEKKYVEFDRLNDLIIPRHLILENQNSPIIRNIIGKVVRVMIKEKYYILTVTDFFTEDKKKFIRVQFNGKDQNFDLQYVSNGAPRSDEYREFDEEFYEESVQFKKLLENAKKKERGNLIVKSSKSLHKTKRQLIQKKIELKKKLAEAENKNDKNQIAYFKKAIQNIHVKGKGPWEKIDMVEGKSSIEQRSEKIGDVQTQRKK